MSSLMNKGGTTDVYGVKVPKNVAPAASNFMHSQVSICHIMVCSSIVSLIFGLVMTNKFKEIADLMVYMHPGNTAEPNQQTATMEAMFASQWITGIISTIFTCCFGIGVVGIARLFLSSRNKMGLKICCIIEGIYAGCACCQCVGGMIYFVLVIMWLAIMSNAQGVCDAIYNQVQNAQNATLNAVAANQQQMPALPGGSIISGNTTNPIDVAKCVQAVEGLHGIGVIFAAMLAIIMCLMCGYVSSCAGGAKFANETENLLDDEEAGGDEYSDNEE